MRMWNFSVLTAIVVVAVHSQHTPHYTRRSWHLDSQQTKNTHVRSTYVYGLEAERGEEHGSTGRGSRRGSEESEDTANAHLSVSGQGEKDEERHHNYTGWSPELLAGRSGADGSEARRVVSGVPAPSGSILANTLSVYDEIKGEILGRWGAKYASTPLFSKGMEFSDGGRVVEDKMLNAVLEQRSFLAAFTGISTTAGHDCLYEESYPVVLNGTMGRLMAAAGVRYEAVNVAMGNTRVAPYSFCVDAHAGFDADIVSWDMYMMVEGKQPSASSVELFVRSASILPRRPAVLITDASPSNKNCPSMTARVQKRNIGNYGGGTPNNLMEIYHDFGLHSMRPSSLVPENTCDDELFAYDHLYNSSMKDSPHPASWHAGPPGHQLIADMLFMHYAEVFLGALRRLEVAAPGVTGRQLRGLDVNVGADSAVAVGQRQVATKTLRETLDLGRGAVYDIEDNGGDNIFVGGGRGDILPPPAWCAKDRLCSAAGDYRCSSTYFPLAGGAGSRLLDMVSESSLPVVNQDQLEYFVEPTVGHWALTLNEEAPNLKRYLNALPPAGFHHPIDKKWCLVGNEASGPIEFEFETVGTRPQKGGEGENADGGGDDGRGADEQANEGLSLREISEQQQMNWVRPELRVIVCKPDFIDRVDFTDSNQVKFSLDGVEVSVARLQQGRMHEGSCVVLEGELEGVGRHKLTVEPLHSGQPYVAISHVLYPA